MVAICAPLESNVEIATACEVCFKPHSFHFCEEGDIECARSFFSRTSPCLSAMHSTRGLFLPNIQWWSHLVAGCNEHRSTRSTTGITEVVVVTASAGITEVVCIAIVFCIAVCCIAFILHCISVCIAFVCIAVFLHCSCFSLQLFCKAFVLH